MYGPPAAAGARARALMMHAVWPWLGGKRERLNNFEAMTDSGGMSTLERSNIGTGRVSIEVAAVQSRLLPSVQAAKTNWAKSGSKNQLGEKIFNVILITIMAGMMILFWVFQAFSFFS